LFERSIETFDVGREIDGVAPSASQPALLPGSWVELAGMAEVRRIKCMSSEACRGVHQPSCFVFLTRLLF